MTRKIVDAFLARPRKRFDRYKLLSVVELDQLAATLPAPIPLWGKLKLHQRAMALAGARAKRLALFADTGVGKTITSLSLVLYFYRLGLIQRVLVLVPTVINKAEWENEILKHTPDLSYCILDGSSKTKWRQLETTDAVLFIESYPGLTRMVCDNARIISDDRAVLVPNREAAHALANHFHGLILDESTAVGNSESLPFRICRQLSKKAQIVYTLTATPFGRDPTPLWTQMYLIDHGKTLGETLGLFRTVFFKEGKGYRHQREYRFIAEKKPLLNRILTNRSIRYRADEADLPLVTEIKKTVALPSDALTYYARALRAIRDSKGNRKIVKNNFLRMRQISSGFIGYRDDDSGEHSQFDFPDNPKLDMLISLVQSLSDKAIIFYEFTHSAFKIIDELKKLGIDYVHIWSGTKEPREALQRFQKQAVPVLIMQNRFGQGLNLQAAKYAIFYESPVSPIMRKQCRRRVERQHSRHKRVFIYDLVCRNTVDETILDWIQQGDDLLAAIIDGKVRL